MVNNRLPRALPLLLLCALMLGACDKARQAIPGGKDKPKTSEAGFKMGAVRAIDPQDRGDSGQKANDEAPKVTTLMNNFYNAAFLDPSKWQAGKHPDLAALFTAEAQPGQAANLGNLAMAELSDKVESVEPKLQSIDRLTFFVDADGSLPLGIASVSFDGTGKTKAGNDFGVTHRAHFWLQRDGDSYKISAFETSLLAAEDTAS